jgi:hypothetical protein
LWFCFFSLECFYFSAKNNGGLGNYLCYWKGIVFLSDIGGFTTRLLIIYLSLSIWLKMQLPLKPTGVFTVSRKLSQSFKLNSAWKANRYPISTLIIEPAFGESSIPEKSLPRLLRKSNRLWQCVFVVARLAETISQHTRQIDLVVDLDQNGRFMIVCPGTSAENL